MAGETDLVKIPPLDPVPVRARHWKVQVVGPNHSQYQRTLGAFVEAGMPLQMIANAARSLGDEVDEGEVDAPFSPNFQRMGNGGVTVEDPNKIVAWQNRGEKTEIAPQIDSPTPMADAMEIVPIAQAVTTSSDNGQIDVVEGMGVFKKQPDQLSTNPFLQPLTDLKKAA